jgi:hypothetical protein
MSKYSKIRKATVTNSLRMIVEDILKVDRKRNPGDENITVDSTLVWLAGRGLASKEKSKGQRVWVAAPRLLDRYELGDGIDGLANGKEAEIRIDKFLETIYQDVFDIRKVFRLKVHKRKIVTESLPLQELHGDAIAYTDAEGHLAWKAAPHMRREPRHNHPSNFW